MQPRWSPIVVWGGVTVVVLSAALGAWLYWLYIVDPRQRLDAAFQRARDEADYRARRLEEQQRAAEASSPAPPSPAPLPAEPVPVEEHRRHHVPSAPPAPRCTEVGGYYRRNGTYVHGYTRCR